MKKLSPVFAFVVIFLTVVALTMVSCKESNSNEPNPTPSSKIEVVKNNIPFPTDKFLRIPYSLKIWEYEKEGLKLEAIHVLDDITKNELIKLEGEDIPIIYKSPLKPTTFYTQDEITSYYLSIQLPIPLNLPKPTRVSHKLALRDTINNKIVYVEGGVFSPRLAETPISISSPVKGENWLFINQSTNEYHFFVQFFTEGKLYDSERFAFDNLRLDANMTNYFSGDPTKNTSYFNYGDTLYAVLDGKILTLKDGRPENNGNMKDVPLNALDEYAGNYIVQDIGNGRRAFYAHIKPNSFFVSQGAVVKEGDPIALLGNSGNSDAPHLHFHIFEGTENILLSYGVPFVLKKYTKVAEWDTVAVPVTPVVIQNAMMEEMTVISF